MKPIQPMLVKIDPLIFTVDIHQMYSMEKETEFERFLLLRKNQ